MYFANSIEVLYLARVISGITHGSTYTLVPMYLGEIASDKIRGSILTIFTIMNKIGYVYAFSIGPYFSIRLTILCGLLPPLLFLILVAWLPETPYYLVGKNRNIDAELSLRKLRHHNDVKNELVIIQNAIDKSNQNKGTLRELVLPGIRKSVIIIFGLATIQYFSGSTAILIYAQLIFRKIESNVGPNELSIILVVVQLLTAIISSYLVDTFGRRFLLIFSICGSAISNTLIGLYFFLERLDEDVSNLGWLPITALMSLMFCYIVGLGTAPYALLGEIFPKHLKAFAGTTYTFYCTIISAVVKKLFQVISDSTGNDVVFFCFAGCCYLFIPFIWYLIPETKRQPLSEILINLNLNKIKK